MHPLPVSVLFAGRAQALDGLQMRSWPNVASQLSRLEVIFGDFYYYNEILLMAYETL